MVRASPLVPAAALAVALAACAGPQRPWSGAGYCHLDPAGAPAGHERWIALLLRGYDPATKRTTTPPVDCANRQVRWEGPAQACAEGALASTLLPARPLGEADVVVSPLAERFRLVWVMTNRFATGEAVGPVAVVEERGGELAVRALGTLRAYPERAALRLETAGTLTVLVAEGTLCAGGKGADCVRGARLMPLRGDLFAEEQLRTPEGACASAAWVDLSRTEREALPSGWTRSTQLEATLAFGPSGVRVSEQVQVLEGDPRAPQTPPRLTRKAEGEREIVPQGERLVSTAPSLWSKVATPR